MGKVKNWNFLEGVLSYVDFVNIICLNKYIINISYEYWRFFNAIKYLVFKVRHVEITEYRAEVRSHRYTVCLRVNITKLVVK